MENEKNFERWFDQATGYKPYPFQKRFAWSRRCSKNPSRLVREGKGEGGSGGVGLLVCQ